MLTGINTLIRRRLGFSLVELLVVIGIVAVLVSMLLPAAARVRRQANSTVCKSNLRQCGVLILAYANENRGWLFPVELGALHPRGQRWPLHVFKPPVWNPPVMLCPDDEEPAEEHSYVLNNHLKDAGIKYGVKAGISPDRVVVMGEKVSTQPDYYMEFLDDGSEFFEVVELYRHGVYLGSNYLFLDLHVDSVAPEQAEAAVDPWDVPAARNRQ